jgi:Mce-associated membrane protein
MTLPDQPRRSRRSLAGALAGLSAVLLAAVVVLAVLFAQSRSDLHAARHARDDRDAAMRVASALTSRALTYDYRNLDATRTAVLALATGHFADDYRDKFAGLKEILVAAQAEASVVVKRVYLSDIDHGSADALVLVDSTVNGRAGTRQSLDQYVAVSLLKVSGKWRVDDFSPIELAPQSAAAAGTTTTTAP